MTTTTSNAAASTSTTLTGIGVGRGSAVGSVVKLAAAARPPVNEPAAADVVKADDHRADDHRKVRASTRPASRRTSAGSSPVSCATRAEMRSTAAMSRSPRARSVR